MSSTIICSVPDQMISFLHYCELFQIVTSIAVPMSHSGYTSVETECTVIAITLYTHIQEVVSLNLSQDVGCPDNFSLVLLSPSSQILGWYRCQTMSAFHILYDSPVNPPSTLYILYTDCPLEIACNQWTHSTGMRMYRRITGQALALNMPSNKDCNNFW
jgi:hypothetical protein